VRLLTRASIALALAFFAIAALGGAPVLSPAQVQAFVGPIEADVQEEVGTSRLPITLAHRTGAPELIAEVDRALAALPLAQRRDLVLLVDSFGQAGALELFGRSRGYPAVFSPHNGYALWGPGPDTRTDPVMAIGIDEAWLRERFSAVREVGRIRCDYCNLWLDDVPILLATDPHQPLYEVWEELVRFGISGRKLRMLRAQRDLEPEAATIR
jgi:hypothetical protein